MSVMWERGHDPESLRTPPPQQSQPQGTSFSGMNMTAMMSAGAQWTEVVNLAQNGRKFEAIEKYMAFTGQIEWDPQRVVESLAGAQMYEFTPAAGYTSAPIAPIINKYADTARSVMRWSLWLGCGITAFIISVILVTMIPVLAGVPGTPWAVFNSP